MPNFRYSAMLRWTPQLLALLLLLQQQVDHLADPSSSLVGASLGCIDPAQERLSIKLSQPVEEFSCNRFGVERSPDVVSEIVTLRTLRKQHDVDDIARSDTAISPPRSTEHDPETVRKRFDRGPDVHSVHRAADPMV